MIISEMKVRTFCLSLIHQHRCLVVTAFQQRPDLCFRFICTIAKFDASQTSFVKWESFVGQLLCKILSKQWNLEQLSSASLALYMLPSKVHPYSSRFTRFIIKELFHICAWTWLLYKGYRRTPLLSGHIL